MTNWGNFPIKFRTDVAMMGKLGYDIVVSHMPANDLAFSQQALKTYDRLKPVIYQGDLFRLQSPHTNDVASVMYVSEKQDEAVWFSYLVNSRFKAGSDLSPIRLRGLQPHKQYSIQGTNLMPGAKSPLTRRSPTRAIF